MLGSFYFLFQALLHYKCACVYICVSRVINVYVLSIIA